MPNATATTIPADFLTPLKSPAARAALARQLDKQIKEAIGYAREHHFTARGPHSLNRKTSRLRNSIRSTPAQWNGDTLTATVGTNVEYAAVHEYGSNATVQVRAHTRKAHKVTTGTKTTKTGKTRKTYRKVAEGTVRAHTRKNNFPARAPLQTSLDEYLPKIQLNPPLQ